jgi:4-amino-4-deoxy-L-arabinose transferase-like glycosyltransferase
MNTILSRARQYPRSLFFALAAGLLLRILFVSIHQRPLFSDEKEYDQLAYNLAAKGIYSYDTNPTAYRPVGYPAFVSSVYFFFGHHPLLVKLIQASVDVLIAFLIYLLLVNCSERTRIFGAALWVFFAPAIFYTNLLLSETLFTFLFVLVVWMVTRDSASSTWMDVVLGALLGVLTLIKPTVLVFVLLLPFMFRRMNIPARKIITIAVAFFALLTPWLLRNYIVFGEIALSSNGGVNLMIGNNLATTGAYKYPFDSLTFQDAHNEFELDHKAFHFAADYIVHHPIATAANAAKKVGRLFESEGGLLVTTFHETPEDASTRYATKYSSLPVFWIGEANVSYFLLTLAALFGFLATDWSRLSSVALCAIFSWLLVHAVFFGGGRFHFPLMPLAAVYAAQFLSDPKRAYASLSRLQKGIALVGAVGFCTLWIIEAYAIFHG